MYKIAEHDQLENALVDTWLDILGQGCAVISDGIIVMLNQAAGHLLGIDAKNVIGKNARQLSSEIKEPMQLNLLLGSSSLDGAAICQRQTPQGERHLHFKAHWAEQRDADVAARFRVVGITDITTIIEKEQELASHNRRWQAMSAGVVLVSVNEPDLPIEYVNPAFEEMTGYSARECIGRNCRFLQGNLHDQPGLAHIRKALLEKRNGYAVLRNFRKDGTEFLNELFVSPVTDQQGNLTHFLGVQHLRQASSPATIPSEGGGNVGVAALP